MKASAVVLVEAERAAMQSLGPRLAELPNVRRVYGVTGEWDFVVTIDVDDHAELRALVTETLGAVEGVARTQTLVALDTYEGPGSPA